MELQLSDVLQNFSHLLQFTVRQEGDWILVPFKVHDIGIEPDGVIGGNEMVWKMALAYRRDVNLLSTPLQVYLSGGSILALDVHGGEGGQVCNEVPLVQLVDLLLDRNHLERAQVLGCLELLHVQ
jgi:hypothetical protein